jgi:ribulose-bisphosphate carboxylase small chain
MRVTQGCFSYLPDLTDEQISKQIQYCLDNNWSVSLEYTDDPHPRNTYWEMWGHPMFDISDAKAIMDDLAACRRAHGERYIRLCAFDSSHTWESLRISFLVQRPSSEPGFMLVRQEADGRNLRYETRAYVMEKPEGSRYGSTEA